MEFPTGTIEQSGDSDCKGFDKPEASKALSFDFGSLQPHPLKFE